VVAKDKDLLDLPTLRQALVLAQNLAYAFRGSLTRGKRRCQPESHRTKAADWLRCRCCHRPHSGDCQNAYSRKGEWSITTSQNLPGTASDDNRHQQTIHSYN
jgi:hypothetical protein